MPKNYDFVVVGAGIVGLAIARELHARHPQQSICVLEKELDTGKHASGRNSGVLHSGIYYAPGSMKARVSVEGRGLMMQYCDENNLPIVRAGKVILPVRPDDDRQLDILLSRAKANGVRADLLDQNQLREVEPKAHSITGKALYVPDACVVDPKAILHHIVEDLRSQNVETRFGTRVTSVNAKASEVTAGNDSLSFGHLFNAAGAYADVVAKGFGVGSHYTILPFRGLYYRVDPAAEMHIQHLIYAVPDLRVPFLGVHYMRTVSGDVFLGPTVIPAFGRENYTFFQGLNLFDTSEILLRIAQQYARNNQGFRRLVHQESLRFLRHYFAQAAQSLTPDIRPKHLLPCDKVGIRAQLLDTRSKELVMDFLIEGTSNSTHVLNAVSPAFTSSFAFSRLVLDQSALATPQTV